MDIAIQGCRLKEKRDWKVRAVSAPEPGFFMIRMVKGGPRLPARIHHENGCWWASVGTREFARHADPLRAPWVERIWHGGEDIDAAEHEHRVRALRAAQADPAHPANRPRQPIDLTKLKSLF